MRFVQTPFYRERQGRGAFLPCIFSLGAWPLSPGVDSGVTCSERLSSGFHEKTTIFPEMSVKGKSCFDMKSLHQDKTDTVGEAEIMIGKGFKNLPGFFDDIRCDMLNVKKTGSPKVFPEPNGYGMASPGANDGVALVQDVVARNQSPTCLETSVTETQGVVMMGISPVFDGQKSRGICKDHW